MSLQTRVTGQNRNNALARAGTRALVLALVEIIRATSLADAVNARSAHPGAELLAGGTDLMVEVNLAHYRPDVVIGIRRVEELREWEGARLGAGVTWARMEDGPHRALAQLSRTVGSPQIRNAGTIGGNLGTASPAGDGLPWLAALDADIELVSVRGTRRVRWDEFITGVKRTTLADDEIIAAAILPDQIPERQEFAKIGVRNAMVISTVSACVMRTEADAWRIALGSVAPTPMRARRAEQVLGDDRTPSEATLSEVARVVSEEVSPITDHRSTEEYRRHAAGVLARRLVARCAA